MESHAKLIAGAFVPCVALLGAVLKGRRAAKKEPDETQSSLAGVSRPAKRALPLVYPTGSEWTVGWGELAQNPYDKETNPNGCINLGMAENRLSLDILQSWVNFHPEATALGGGGKSASLSDMAGYPEYHGIPSFRQAVASLLDTVLGGPSPFDPECVVVTCGASAAIEMLAFCLGDPGDAFIVPTPYYSGFEKDVLWRSQVALFPAHTSSRDAFKVSQECLQKAYEEITAKKLRARAILLSSPNNPTGCVYDAQTLMMILAFAKKFDLHVICDEIYGGSVFGEPEFRSIAGVMSEDDVDRVHIIYGLSKDMGLPGFRVGVLYTENAEVLSAAKKTSRVYSVSTQTQTFLSHLLSDIAFVKDYLAENQRRLAASRKVLVDALEAIGIEVAKGNSGQFVWINLRSLLDSRNSAGEMALNRRLVFEAGLVITPGNDCHCAEAGWFRLCFAMVDIKVLHFVVERIGRLIELTASTKSGRKRVLRNIM